MNKPCEGCEREGVRSAGQVRCDDGVPRELCGACILKVLDADRSRNEYKVEHYTPPETRARFIPTGHSALHWNIAFDQKKARRGA